MTSKHNIKIDVKQEDIGKRFKTSSSSSPPTGTATNTTVKTENVSPNANNINEGTTNITLHPKQQLAIDLATIVKTENLSPNANNSNEGTTNITLHPKQQLAIDLAAQGKSIFVTGQGGTGKSLVLREIIKGFKQQRYRSDEWAALAPTGIAAIALESGRTVHSFEQEGMA
jgi:ATP-dependent exoDNAse (exonuclease V) alpha subunit